MYTILVDENHCLITTKKEKIMQRSQGVNSLLFLVKQEMNDLNINNCTVLFEYWTPISKEYDSLILSPEGTYGDYLQFIVPFNLPLTKEHGNLQTQLSFIYVDLDEDGNSIQKVKKTTVADIKITPIAAWSNMMPDSNFTAIDQRIIMTTAQIKALENLSEAIVNEKADNIKYDKDENSLQLVANKKTIGDKVVLKGGDGIFDPSDGIPVIDLDDLNIGDNDNPDNITDDEDDNVIEL